MYVGSAYIRVFVNELSTQKKQTLNFAELMGKYIFLCKLKILILYCVRGHVHIRGQTPTELYVLYLF
jgi:hypothetical protein